MIIDALLLASFRLRVFQFKISTFVFSSFIIKGYKWVLYYFHTCTFSYLFIFLIFRDSRPLSSSGLRLLWHDGSTLSLRCRIISRKRLDTESSNWMSGFKLEIIFQSYFNQDKNCTVFRYMNIMNTALIQELCLFLWLQHEVTGEFLASYRIFILSETKNEAETFCCCC